MIPVVEVRDLHVRFHGERNVYAVNGVDINLGAGEVLGLLGESGAGKSVTLRALLRMLPPRRSDVAGSIRIAGEDVMAMDDAALGRLRGGVAAMIFQEPMLALDPVFTVGHQIAETVVRHRGVGWAQARAPSRRWRACAFPPRAGVSMPIRMSCPAACASAP
jgi:peptide/nickel transport system ATP-binding protein